MVNPSRPHSNINMNKFVLLCSHTVYLISSARQNWNSCHSCNKTIFEMKCVPVCILVHVRLLCKFVCMCMLVSVCEISYLVGSQQIKNLGIYRS